MWRTASVALASLAAGVAAALWVAGGGSPREEPAEPGWTRLPNGLRFCVRPIEGATDVAVLTSFDIGSDQDPAGRSGLGHLVEHLYVTAAAGETGPRSVESWLTSHGGRCAAGTEGVSTNVIVVVPPAGLDAELRDAAARMSDLRIEQSDLDRERPRVMGQIADLDRTLPSGGTISVAVRRLFPSSHGDLPTGVGVPAEVAGLTLGDVRAWAQRFYRPVNARIVVAGAVERAAAADAVERLFAPLASGEPAPLPDTLPPRPGLTEVEEARPTTEPDPGPHVAVCIAYPFDAPDDDDLAAQAMFAARAADGSRQPGSFLVWRQDRALVANWCGEPWPVEQVVACMDRIVAQIATPAPNEFERRFARGMTGLEPRADAPVGPDVVALGLAALSRAGGDPDRILRRIDRLTAEDLSRFAARWLAPERRVVAVVRSPKDRTAVRPEPREETLVVLRWDAAKATILGTLDGSPVADDDALETLLVAKRAPAVPVVLHVADARIPWDEVRNVADVIRRSGVRTVEFRLGPPPGDAPPK